MCYHIPVKFLQIERDFYDWKRIEEAGQNPRYDGV